MHYPEKETVRYTTKRVWVDKETVTRIELRFTSLENLEQRLEALGFEVFNRYGDFDKNLYTDTSQQIILVCRIK